jgi:hypothetical protein
VRGCTLDELWAQADVISLHCPLTPATRHLHRRHRAGPDAAGAIVINTARGGCIDEAALADALHAGHLGAAGLDVFAAEPAIHPRLLAAPRTILAPHLGSATTRARVVWPSCASTAVRDVLAGANRQPGARVTAPHVLLVTSSAAEPAVVVPVLAACEAPACACARSISARWAVAAACQDRMRRALLGETRRAAAAQGDRRQPARRRGRVRSVSTTAALTTARDAVTNPAPVIGVVGELEPGRGWGETNADRVCAIDDHAAVALAEAGVEADRIVVVGPVGEYAFADAGAEARAALQARFAMPPGRWWSRSPGWAPRRPARWRSSSRWPTSASG